MGTPLPGRENNPAALNLISIFSISDKSKHDGLCIIRVIKRHFLSSMKQHEIHNNRHQPRRDHGLGGLPFSLESSMSSSLFAFPHPSLSMSASEVNIVLVVSHFGQAYCG